MGREQVGQPRPGSPALLDTLSTNVYEAPTPLCQLTRGHGRQQTWKLLTQLLGGTPHKWTPGPNQKRL